MVILGHHLQEVLVSHINFSTILSNTLDFCYFFMGRDATLCTRTRAHAHTHGVLLQFLSKSTQEVIIKLSYLSKVLKVRLNNVDAKANFLFIVCVVCVC